VSPLCALGRIATAGCMLAVSALSPGLGRAASTAALTLPPLRVQLDSALERARNEPVYVQVGTFRLYPELVLTELYDDNVFTTPRNRQDDTTTIVTASGSLRSNWREHRLRTDVGLEIGRHAEFTDDSYHDYWLELEGRFDLSRTASVFAGIGHRREHEERGSPNDVAGIEPTVYHDAHANLGVQGRSSRWSGRLSLAQEQLAFEDVHALDISTGIPGGPTGRDLVAISNDDRDRETSTLGGRLGYFLSPRLEAFWRTDLNTRAYRLMPDADGFYRNSKGYTTDLGLAWQPGKAFEGQLYAGQLRQNYDDARLVDVHTADYGGTLAWRITRATRLSAYLERSVQETIIPEASSYLASATGVRFEQRSDGDLVLRIWAGMTRSDFQGIARSDDTYDAGAEYRYAVGRHLFLGVAYDHLRNSSTEPVASFQRNQVFLKIGRR